jgi:lipopolysaccharide/colanic/teichoic acid biosynthesis glycosyltransferase/NDP-sugar pyrophosphorylase family protein
MKAVILTGPGHGRLDEFSRPWPTPLIPVLNRSLLEFQIRMLRCAGVEDVTVSVTAEHLDLVYAELGQGEKLGVQLSYLPEVWRGPAGILKQAVEASGQRVLALEGDVIFERLHLGDLVAAHNRSGAIATLGVARAPRQDGHADTLSVDRDGHVVTFEPMHPDWDRRRSRRFVGVAVFEAEAFEYVPDDAFFDIREQMIPALRAAGCRVGTQELAGFAGSIRSLEDYRSLQCQQLWSQTMPPEGYRPIDADVWIEEEVAISSSARLAGPLLIGRGSVIGPDAQVIGPSSIGRGCRIEEGALVVESVLWEGARLGPRERVAHAVMRPARAPEPLQQSGPSAPAEVVQAWAGGAAACDETVADLGRLLAVLAGKACKRALDIVVSAVGLILLLPLFAGVALAIKLESRGRVFFAQRRLGRHGRDFPMIKFRSMVTGAEQMRTALAARSDVDGPVFKMFEDPRLTRVGRILRATSIDELPQLLNVLCGQMSLVGPRPLVEEELRFSPAWRHTRLRVRPGITGLWQVSGRSNSGFHDWITRDTEYVRTQSLLLDLKILLATVAVVLRREGTH